MIDDRIRVVCHTNLDLNRNEKWPDYLSCRPCCGDVIISNTGLELKVVRITHMKAEGGEVSNSLDVELHLVNSNITITEFEKWYRNRNRL